MDFNGDKKVSTIVAPDSVKGGVIWEPIISPEFLARAAKKVSQVVVSKASRVASASMEAPKTQGVQYSELVRYADSCRPCYVASSRSLIGIDWRYEARVIKAQDGGWYAQRQTITHWLGQCARKGVLDISLLVSQANYLLGKDKAVPWKVQQLANSMVVAFNPDKPRQKDLSAQMWEIKANVN